MNRFVMGLLIWGVAGTGLVPARAADIANSAAPADSARPVHRHHAAGQVPDRVGAFIKMLNLDAGQQVELRRLLREQQAQVERIWSDGAVPPAYRVGATRRISEATADKIRLLLTEKQRTQYNQPRQTRAVDADNARSVEDWISAANAGNAVAAP